MKEQTYLNTIYHYKEGRYPFLLALYLVTNYMNHAYNRRLLDIGSGKHAMMMAFTAHHINCVGVNKSDCNLEHSFLPFDTESFDYVFSKSCIEHIWNTENVLAETYRVLKPGGIAIFLTPDWATDYKYFWDDPTHVRAFTRKGLQDAFKFMGFVDVKCEHFWQLPWLWRYPFLEPLRWIISLLPNRWKWKDREELKQRVLVRHSKERMLICVAYRPIGGIPH